MEVDQSQAQLNSEAFSKFISDLFEKNGVLNDLRAHLRSQIYHLLKNEQDGDQPKCNKLKNQRLKPKSQALNMLLSEYLMNEDYNYTVSVFVSEIPLTDMKTYNFAQQLLNCEHGDEIRQHRFNETDVNTILEHLGMDAGSKQAVAILKSYHDSKSPLLGCILDNMSTMKQNTDEVSDTNSSDSDHSNLSTSASGDKHKTEMSNKEKCAHYSKCRNCQQRVRVLKHRCRKKDSEFIETSKASPSSRTEADKMLKNVAFVEKDVLEKLLSQMKSIYESKMLSIKDYERSKVKQALTPKIIELQQTRKEMEQAFQYREQELQKSMEQKKQFVWNLAQSLRKQHCHMTEALAALKHESRRISDKEKKLDKQLLESEVALNRRGEELKHQLTKELKLLGEQLQQIRQERKMLKKEREEVEAVRDTTKRKDPEIIDAMKRYLYTTMEPNEIEYSGVDLVPDPSSMNNELEPDKTGPDRLLPAKSAPYQLVNDFTKEKNVNSQLPITETKPKPEESVRQRQQLTCYTAQSSAQRKYEPLNRNYDEPTQLNSSCTSDGSKKNQYHPPLENICDICRAQGKAQLMDEELPYKKSTRYPVKRKLSPKVINRTCRNVIGNVTATSNLEKGEPKKTQSSSSPERSFHRYAIKKEMSPHSMLLEARNKLKSKTCAIQKKFQESRDQSPRAILREARRRLRSLEAEADAVQRSYLDFKKRQTDKDRGGGEKENIPKDKTDNYSREKRDRREGVIVSHIETPIEEFRKLYRHPTTSKKTTDKTSSDNEKSQTDLDYIILQENLKKLYKLNNQEALIQEEKTIAGVKTKIDAPQLDLVVESVVENVKFKGDDISTNMTIIMEPKTLNNIPTITEVKHDTDVKKIEKVEKVLKERDNNYIENNGRGMLYVNSIYSIRSSSPVSAKMSDDLW